MGKSSFQKIIEDFRCLNNSDPATWLPIPRFTVLLILFVLVIGVGGYLFVLDQMDALDSVKAKETRLRDEYIKGKQAAASLELYRQQLEEIDKSFGALLQQLPNRTQVDALLQEVNQAGVGQGLQFELFRPSNEVMREFYVELPIAVRIVGSYHDLGSFAADVAKLPRIVTLSGIRITPSGGVQSMEMQLKTYRYIDEAEQQAKQAQTKKGGKRKK
ncbi:MAG: type 4a pilus biogenesis protein PilO [Zoogloeaceae bacterium]|jgi:type IV pilus assembly protein PilO|nr:type 4a pilus biogenesis protein PilO [Zoogloeaceae bacterium]